MRTPAKRFPWRQVLSTPFPSEGYAERRGEGWALSCSFRMIPGSVLTPWLTLRPLPWVYHSSLRAPTEVHRLPFGEARIGEHILLCGLCRERGSLLWDSVAFLDSREGWSGCAGKESSALNYYINNYNVNSTSVSLFYSTILPCYYITKREVNFFIDRISFLSLKEGYHPDEPLSFLFKLKGMHWKGRDIIYLGNPKFKRKIYLCFK